MQQALFEPKIAYTRPRASLLKWVGNKYRMAEEIASYFPADFGTLFEVFLGGGSVLATVAPQRGIGADSFGPLIEIWNALRVDPSTLKRWYDQRWSKMMKGEKVEVYESIKASYNKKPNAADFLFLTRTCYGGVVRFRRDGYMSTPCGPHIPISPEAFAARVDEWNRRVQGCKFVHCDYADVMKSASAGDVVYCDPPYTHTQAILYGAQDFSLKQLFRNIAECKRRGVFVALSIDGSKRSGDMICDLPIPKGLFEREVPITVGRSMLKRFQSNGKTLEGEVVTDRLLLTY